MQLEGRLCNPHIVIQPGICLQENLHMKICNSQRTEGNLTPKIFARTHEASRYVLLARVLNGACKPCNIGVLHKNYGPTGCIKLLFLQNCDKIL